MKYEITKVYEVKEFTCGEALKVLDESGGDVYCLHEFIDPSFPDDVTTFHDSWGWVRSRRPSKKILLVVDEISSVGKGV